MTVGFIHTFILLVTYHIIKFNWQEMFGVDLPPYQIHGVLALGHSQQQIPKIADGFCLTILVSLQRQLEEVILTNKYSWHQVNLEIEDNLLSKMEEFHTVAIRSINIHTHH